LTEYFIEVWSECRISSSRGIYGVKSLSFIFRLLFLCKEVYCNIVKNKDSTLLPFPMTENNFLFLIQQKKRFLKKQLFLQAR